MDDDDKDEQQLTPEQTIMFFGDMMKRLVARYGMDRAVEMFNEASRRAGVEMTVVEAPPEKAN